MFKFILKRLGYMFVTLWIVATITFMLIHAIPGDPLAGMARKLPEQIRANFYAKYGLDQPVVVQYGRFMKNIVLHGDLGESLAYQGRKVTDVIKITCANICKTWDTSSCNGIFYRCKPWNISSL